MVRRSPERSRTSRLGGRWAAFQSESRPRVQGGPITLVTGLLQALTEVNLLWYNNSQLKSVPISGSAAADWLAAQPGLFRVHSPDGSILAHAPFQQANEIDSLHLGSYASFLGKAAGMVLPGYSVSVPN